MAVTTDLLSEITAVEGAGSEEVNLKDNLRQLFDDIIALPQLTDDQRAEVAQLRARSDILLTSFT